MNNKKQNLVDEFKMREEIYKNDMLNEYYFYEDDLIDSLRNLVHAVRLG